MLKRLNDVLPELILGILIYGVLVQIIGMWFVEDKLQCSIGFWIGILLAMGMSVHMAMVIEDAVSLGYGQRRLVIMSVLRYAVVVLVFAGMIIFHIGNPIAAFVGLLGLKPAAYMQPFLHKLMLKIKGEEENPKDNGVTK